MSWIWGSTTNIQFEELAEKACSPLNLPYPQSENLMVALETADMIRSKSVLSKGAMQSLKRRIASKNGRVQMYAIALTDTCIKNGGDHFLLEVASKEFVDEMSNLIKSAEQSPEVKQMLLNHFQQWALAFQSKPELSFFVDVYNELKSSGVTFPPPPTSVPSHLLTTTTAPTWVESDVCMRCRSAFTFTNRKHHCRNCGQIFDQACSSHTMALPKYGITEGVRVCDGCWIKSGKGKSDAPAPVIPGKTLRSRADVDADLQRAIELSLAESHPGQVNHTPSEPPAMRADSQNVEDDEQMRLAIEASLRDMEVRPSAPVGLEEPEYRPLPTFDLTPRENETILTFSNTIDQMAAYGERDLRRFPHAHVLAEQAGALGERLRRNVDEKATKQQMLMEMQSKLSQAVNMYGTILDGQQAYTQRKFQESQAMRYQQQQQQYYAQQYQPQAYGQYAPNGYQHFGASQQVYQAPQAQPQPAAPSLYPSMPYVTPGYVQQPQIYPQQPYRQESSPAPSGYPSQWTPGPASMHAPVQAAHQSVLARHASMAPSSPAPAQASLQRQTSVTYGAPVPASSEPIALHPSATVDTPSAPPPVDLSTHPSSPPQPSTLYSAPSKEPTQPPQEIPTLASAPPADGLINNTSYASGSSMEASSQAMQTQREYEPHVEHTERLAIAPPLQTQADDPAQYQPHSQPQYRDQKTYTPSQPEAQQQYHLPQGVYNVDSFPQSLPPTIFPDAPMEAPQGLEAGEKEERLLIEL